MQAPIGIVVNPRSGKDVRRLVAQASVFDNREKAAIVRRALVGAINGGATHFVYMDDSHNIAGSAFDGMDSGITATALASPQTATALDTERAASQMAELGCVVVLVLGGDGTSRAFVRGWREATLLPVSTGTNNVFPGFAEATVAGAAMGLIASGQVRHDDVVTRSKIIDIEIEGEKPDLALIDAVVTRERFIGARALLDAGELEAAFLTRAEPAAVGMTALGGLVHPLARTEDAGLMLKLGGKKRVVNAPIAPGYYQPVGVRDIKVVPFGEKITFKGPCVIAVDGERERVIGKGQRFSMRVSRTGPNVLDINETLRLAALASAFDIGDTRPAAKNRRKTGLNHGDEPVTEANIFSPESMIDPYPAYKQLRDEAPVHFVPEMNLHIVTRYDLLRDAIKRTDEFSSKFDNFLGGAQQMMFASLPVEAQEKATSIVAKMIVTPPTMLTLDEPEHTQYRSLVQKLFTGSQVKKSEEDVRAVVNDSISAMQGKTSGDFMALFAFPVPIEIIADRLGIPADDKPFFYDAATAAAAGLKMAPVSPDELLTRLQLGADLQQLLIRLVEERRAQPKDDMITILANSNLEEADRPLTHPECLSILNQFLVAGHETTASAFGWAMLALCNNPDLQEEIRGDEKRIKTFVEEALRIEAPVQGLPGVVTRDTELGGYALQAGDVIMLRYGAANRDERQFDEPDIVDVNRAKAGMQMAFGSGVHHCIGAPLARQELNIGFYELLNNFRAFGLDPAHGKPVADPSFILRGLPTLNVTWEKI